MRKKILILIGILLIASSSFANKDIGQGDEPDNTPEINIIYFK